VHREAARLVHREQPLVGQRRQQGQRDVGHRQRGGGGEAALEDRQRLERLALGQRQQGPGVVEHGAHARVFGPPGQARRVGVALQHGQALAQLARDGLR